ncbi:taurine ABC transporter ATP-binding subunit [Yersinia mollaretii]|uniref:Taurine import ATP-binding protein tauB n=1 Tax=Yersinia mollaretii (strain ATCC 43969 / DSM 18520 / CIP 103324 / CNY 7263 / WAIP 204) TaxID=349967 RepID=A0ABM9YCY3_YERMW|nr:taurine ABC transporter ATP-binding subunit [Yersinia mollaretii]EEQ11781.1 Taurine import ATP-binding protein tauB [Yersinia mollaretii ATCC 43969]MDN0111420.1 taurine ABC transporter ATP-binding subunit [Yersinia mollaretii]PJE86151.1 taurine transporter ATP-binding subunit [Yersinia mollaretii]QKJ01951.1 taurine ABC transporter ATP-binding subunit [Yersinia mollaretii ATCC 43969]CQD42729.1 taurine transporter ATP-binding subunit [Yersinia mollaretii]
MLNVNHISAKYNGLKVLDDVSLQISHGELLVVLGPSGCGKTTLLNLIAGFITPSAGDITLDGVRIKSPGAERCVVFQSEGLLPWRNVLNNVGFGLQLAGINKTQRDTISRKILKQVGLADFENYFIWQLSGGMRQRVGIARALAANPRMLLLDEPFGALDAFTREQMQELLLKIWRDTGKQILLITHDIEEAIFLASKLLLLSPGPGQVVESLSLDFGRRYASGEACRTIKSDPEFISKREYVLSKFFEQREGLL